MDTAAAADKSADKTTDAVILVGTTTLNNAVAVKSARHQLFIQKITLSLTTHFDTAITFDDDGAGPAIAVYTDEATAAATGQGAVPVVWDFGPLGYALTAGANLDIIVASAGAVGVVHIEAYERPVNAGLYWPGPAGTVGSAVVQ